MSDILKDGLDSLGLISEKDSLLFFTKEKDSYSNMPEIWFQLEKANLYKADGVFFKKGIRKNEYIPQIYIYDRTKSLVVDVGELTEIHKNVWTGGNLPIVCVFSRTEIKILDTTKPIAEKKGSFSPEYLVENLKHIATAHEIYNKNFAQKIKAGTYWDSSDIDFNKHSAYSKLTDLLKKVVNQFTIDSGLKEKKDVVQKLIIQCILVKYLEERRDSENNRVFPSEFFSKYSGATQFSDILINGHVFEFFKDLNENHFNGGIFYWDEDSLKLFEEKSNAFGYLSDVLRGFLDINDQRLIEFEDNFSRLYNFNFIPVELISRLYEEFIIKDEDKEKGVAYTPAHLVRLLVNEAMPVDTPPINLEDFKVLDPACGSAIFLVVAFKRIVEWWRLKNNYSKPNLEVLKHLLRSIYGVDLDSKAVQISVFSLCIALCDELSPKEIWNDLRFDKLEGERIFHKNFFDWIESEGKRWKFDVIIGNPPFVRGGLTKEERLWKISNTIVEIPKRQIALKFLCETIPLLKENKQLCLLVKSSSLLYNSSAIEYRNELFSNFHVDQIFDFTPLARSKSLWDNVDVDASAIFITNSAPNNQKNLLHAVFRRTRTNKERIYFEIDKYDLHFILREEVQNNPYIFKINLVGGGRVKHLVTRMSQYNKLYEKEGDLKILIQEGHGTLQEKEHENPTPINIRLNSKDGIKDYRISEKEILSEDERKRIPDKKIYYAPNILISQTPDLAGKRLILTLSNKNIVIKNRYVAIHTDQDNIEVLNSIFDNLITYNNQYLTYLFATSGKLFIYKNTSILKEDIANLPLLGGNFKTTDKENKLIEDLLTYTQDFIRHGESSFALARIEDFSAEIEFYGDEFSKAINELYADNENSFKLTDIIHFEKENLIGVLFSYDNEQKVIPRIINEKDITGIDGLTHFNINENLSATRIIQYYSPNKVLFVKPNQKRYWLASIAYRDADSVFADILNNQ